MGQTAKVTRENRTITVDFHTEATYDQLLDNTKAFVEFGGFCISPQKGKFQAAIHF